MRLLGANIGAGVTIEPGTTLGEYVSLNCLGACPCFVLSLGQVARGRCAPNDCMCAP